MTCELFFWPRRRHFGEKRPHIPSNSCKMQISFSILLWMVICNFTIRTPKIFIGNLPMKIISRLMDLWLSSTWMGPCRCKIITIKFCGQLLRPTTHIQHLSCYVSQKLDNSKSKVWMVRKLSVCPIVLQSLKKIKRKPKKKIFYFDLNKEFFGDSKLKQNNFRYGETPNCWLYCWTIENEKSRLKTKQEVFRKNVEKHRRFSQKRVFFLF